MQNPVSVDYSTLLDRGLSGIVIVALATVVIPVLWKRWQAVLTEQAEEMRGAIRRRDEEITALRAELKEVQDRATKELRDLNQELLRMSLQNQGPDTRRSGS